MNNDHEEKSSKFPDTFSSELLSGVGPGNVRDYEQDDIVGGRYKVVLLIGRGAMGAVYAVEQVFMKKRYALKTLTSGLASTISQRRFQKEAQAAGQLEHPNIAKAVDFGVDAGRLFLVMDFVEGQALSEHLKLALLSTQEALSIFIPICFALAYAHEHGVIHRDIKPSNIVLAKGDGGIAFIPKIVDFGIAKLADDAEAEALTRTGEVFGTPLYMSPEQCSGIKVDKRSDIYSLGCVIYEALTGTPPFTGQTALETMMQHRTEPIMPMTEASLGLTFPASIEMIVRKMLAKDADDRYQNCLELAEDLIRVQRGEAVDLPASAINSASPARASASGSKLAAKNGMKRSPLSPAIVVVLIVVAFIGILSSFLLLRPHEQKPKETFSTLAEKSTDAPQLVSQPDLCIGNRAQGMTFHFGNQDGERNFSVGSIITLSNIVNGKEKSETKPAKGVIAVPANTEIIEFDASQQVVSQNPTLFRNFRPDDIDRLYFNFPETVRAVECVDSVSFNAGMSYVGALKNLKVLIFSNAPLSSDGLSQLKLDRMHSLTKLVLAGTTLDGNDFIGYKMPPKLSIFEFSHSKNVTTVIKALRNSTEIRALTLRDDHLTDHDLGLIGSMPFGYLDIRDNHEITIAGLKKLKQEGLQLILDGKQYSPDFLASMSQLKYLNVGEVDGVWTKEQKYDLLHRLQPKCKVSFHT